MKRLPPSCGRCALALAWLVLASQPRLSAQTVASAPASAKEEVVTLNAFEVSAAASRGYVTTSSMSASRIAVPITELPASVVVSTRS